MKQSLKDRGFLEELSLSARRAWIETYSSLIVPPPFQSLSARRAWIETGVNEKKMMFMSVALRKEGVD